MSIMQPVVAHAFAGCICSEHGRDSEYYGLGSRRQGQVLPQEPWGPALALLRITARHPGPGVTEGRGSGAFVFPDPNPRRTGAAQEKTASARRMPDAPLASLTPDLFIAAGAIASERTARGGATRSRVEEILRRAVDQAAALRGEAG